MTDLKASSLFEHFAELEDPRIERTKLHQLSDILVITVCAVICGADNWVEVEGFGRAREEWLVQLLGLSNGIPSHDTFGRVYALLDAGQVEACFLSWVQELHQLTKGQLLAIDGKMVRRSHDQAREKRPLHLVSVWAAANRVVLAQTEVDAKGNEIGAIPVLLKMLEVSGCIVTIDAIGCQKSIVQLLTERGADYVLALKRNQIQLHNDVEQMFKGEQEHEFVHLPHDYHQTVEKGHGRIELRRCWATASPEYLDYVNPDKEWTQLQSLVMVECERRLPDHTSYETRYFISSLPPNAKQLLDATRGHWGIENSVHWVLDIAFREDESRIRLGNAQHNLAIVRRMALNLLRHEKTAKVGIAAKRKLAGWNPNYLLKVLQN